MSQPVLICRPGERGETLADALRASEGWVESLDVMHLEALPEGRCGSIGDRAECDKIALAVFDLGDNLRRRFALWDGPPLFPGSGYDAGA